MDIALPSRDGLKALAKRLQSHMADQGHHMRLSDALEAVARQWGFRDWNTAAAASGDTPHVALQLGQAVSGRYLGHPFTGTVHQVGSRPRGYIQVTIDFDQPVTVANGRAQRRRVNATLTPAGRTVERTSDGQPHLVLDGRWNGV